MTQVDAKSHWEKIYSTKAENEVSWFQSYPKTSVEFLENFHLPSDSNIIDVGAGESHFVDVIIEKDFQNIYALDISENALNRAKKRLGKKANQVHWIVSDIIEYKPGVQFDLWHDRAAFHFLTDKERIDKYVDLAAKSIKPNGYLVLGTFSERGPKKCSGLEIHQYSEKSLSLLFENDFKVMKCFTEDHQTPFNTVQNFLFCAFQKKS